MSSSDQIFCANCRAYRTPAFDPDSWTVSCEVCGVTNEQATSSRQLIDYTTSGIAIIDPNDNPVDRSGSDHTDAAAEKEFFDGVEAMIKIWLTGNGSRLIPQNGMDYVKPTMRWYKMIRDAEVRGASERREKRKAKEAAENKNKADSVKKRGKSKAVDEEDEYDYLDAPDLDETPTKEKKNKPARNINTRRVPYHVAIAIHLALQESHLAAMYNKLEDALGEGSVIRPATTSHGRTGDGMIQVPSLDEIMGNKHLATLDSRKYLRSQHRLFVKLLEAHIPAIDAILCGVMDTVSFLRDVMSKSFDERVNMCRPPNSNEVNIKTIWVQEDFDWLENTPWDEVLPMAYKLYRAQQCVALWDHRSGAHVFVALTLISLMLVNQKQPRLVIAYLNAATMAHGTTHWAAAERIIEIKKFLVCWSTSIPYLKDDRGQPFPFPVLQPPKGIAGDGISRWGGDLRRGVPDYEMAIAAGPIIAERWKDLCEIRARNRADALTLETEFMMAKKLFAQHANSKSPVKRRTRKSDPNKKTKKRGAKGLPTPSPASYDETPPISPSPSPSPITHESISSQPDSTDYEPIIEVVHRPKKIRSVINKYNFWRQGKEPTLEDLLREPDDSSDEEMFVDSDDEDNQYSGGSYKYGLPEYRSSINNTGFTIGPQGFSRLPQDTAASSRETTAFLAGCYKSGYGGQSDIYPSPQSISSRRLSVSSSQGSFSTEISRSSTPATLGRNVEIAPPSPRSDGSSTYYRPSVLHSLGSARSSTPSGSQASSDTSHPTKVRRGDGVTLKTMPVEAKFLGKLIRERHQYINLRHNFIEREAGRLVREDVEAFMLDWVERQKTAGSIPKEITPRYLHNLGIETDQAIMSDIGPWVIKMRKEKKWSPAESLLRAGIHPREFPSHYIPHSITRLYIDLYRLNRRLRSSNDIVTPEDIDDELEVLFGVGIERAEDQILSKAEVLEREALYKEKRIFEDMYDEDGNAMKRRKGKRFLGNTGPRKSRLNPGWEDALNALEDEEYTLDEDENVGEEEEEDLLVEDQFNSLTSFDKRSWKEDAYFDKVQHGDFFQVDPWAFEEESADTPTSSSTPRETPPTTTKKKGGRKRKAETQGVDDEVPTGSRPKKPKSKYTSGVGSGSSHSNTPATLGEVVGGNLSVVHP